MNNSTQLLNSYNQSVRLYKKYKIDKFEETNIVSYVNNYIYHSVAIEGNTLSLSETSNLIEKGITAGGKSIREHNEVLGLKDAYDYMLQHAKKKTVINSDFIMDMHRILMEKVDLSLAGRFKTERNRAGNTLFPDPYKAKILYEKMCEKYSDLAYIGSLSPIHLGAKLHYDFVSIHPFTDGNGRMARLLLEYVLRRNDYPGFVISVKQRNDYIESLSQAQQKQDSTIFEYFIISEATKSLQKRLELFLREEKKNHHSLTEKINDNLTNWND